MYSKKKYKSIIGASEKELQGFKEKYLWGKKGQPRDELSWTLKSHLYIEHCMDELLSLTLPKPNNTVRTRFSDKVGVLEDMGVFDEDLSKMIRSINSIRNKFAHNLEYKLLDKDLGGFLKKIVAPISFQMKKHKKGEKIKKVNILFGENMPNIGKLEIFITVIIHALGSIKVINKTMPYLSSCARSNELFKNDYAYNINKIIKGHSKIMKDLNIKVQIDKVKINKNKGS